jgi:hypothetical protein
MTVELMKIHTSVMERDNLGDVYVDDRIILKLFFKKQDMSKGLI